MIRQIISNRALTRFQSALALGPCKLNLIRGIYFSESANFFPIMHTFLLFPPLAESCFPYPKVGNLQEYVSLP